MSANYENNNEEYTAEEIQIFEERRLERKRVLALADCFSGIPRDTRQESYERWKDSQSRKGDSSNVPKASVRLVSETWSIGSVELMLV
jgi:hypothetical protein